MSRYVDPTKQLVTEIMVSDIRRSTEFYRRLGFALQREAGGLDHLREAAERIVSHATETKASASTPAPQRRHNFGDTASRTMERRAGVW